MQKNRYTDRWNSEPESVPQNDEKDEIEKPNLPPKKRGLKVALTGIALLAGITANSSMYIINESDQAVVQRLSKPVKVIMNPLAREETKLNLDKIRQTYIAEGIRVEEGAGLYFKRPFVDSVTKYSRELLRWDGYPEQIPTKDKKYIFVDTTARVFIEDPLKFLKKVGTVEQMHGRLDEIIDSGVRNSLTKRDLIDIVRSDNRKLIVSEAELEQNLPAANISEGRSVIMTEITDNSRQSCEDLGIGIPYHGVQMRALVYVETVKKDVEDRMISERKRIATKYTSQGEGEASNIMGQTEREVNRLASESYQKAQEIMGNADAKAIKIYADAMGKDLEFYSFQRKLELYNRLGDAKLVTGFDNPLLDLMKGDIQKKK